MLGNGTVTKSLKLFAVLSATSMLAACGTGSSLPSFSPSNLLYGGSVPPSVAEEQEIPECPEIEIREGGAALRSGGEAVKTQVSITNVARECKIDGANLRITVGVEGLVLLGVAGTPGTYPAPVTVVMKRGDKVVASRTQGVSVTIPSNDTQATFTNVLRDIVVPKAGPELSIQVGLGTKGENGESAQKPANKKKR